MAQTLIQNGAQATVIASLDTYNYTVKTASMHVCAVSITMRAPSSISVVIKQGSTTIATSTAPAAAQTVINLNATMNCAVNDVISVIISSSAALDNQPNNMKGIINIHQGSSN